MDLVRTGYLQKRSKASVFRRTTWCRRYFCLYCSSMTGRSRLEYFPTENDMRAGHNVRVLPLHNCISIKPTSLKAYPHLIEVVTVEKAFLLAATSQEEAKFWYHEMCKAVFGSGTSPNRVTVEETPPTKDYDNVDNGTASLRLTSKSSFLNHRKSLSLSCLQEINPGILYEVEMLVTRASQKAQLSGKYLLQLQGMDLVLWSTSGDRTICVWPMSSIRRYGRGKTKFSFECPSGIYTMKMTNPYLLYSRLCALSERISSSQSSAHGDALLADSSDAAISEESQGLVENLDDFISSREVQGSFWNGTQFPDADSVKRPGSFQIPRQKIATPANSKFRETQSLDTTTSVNGDPLTLTTSGSSSVPLTAVACIKPFTSEADPNSDTSASSGETMHTHHKRRSFRMATQNRSISLKVSIDGKRDGGFNDPSTVSLLSRNSHPTELRTLSVPVKAKSPTLELRRVNSAVRGKVDLYEEMCRRNEEFSRGSRLRASHAGRSARTDPPRNSPRGGSIS